MYELVLKSGIHSLDGWLNHFIRAVIQLDVSQKVMIKRLMKYAIRTFNSLTEESMQEGDWAQMGTALVTLMKTGDYEGFTQLLPSRCIIYRPGKFLTLEEFNAQRQPLAESIIANYAELQGLLREHGAEIQEKWGKMDREDREELLNKAWPDIVPRRREGLRSLISVEHDEVSPFAFLCPDINLDSLATNESLLRYLDTRSRHEPYLFAWLDRQSFELGIYKALLSTDVLEGPYSVSFAGHTTGINYGALRTWPSLPEAEEDVASGRSYYPGYGLLILEAQQIIYDGLVKCCNDLLPLNRVIPDVMMGRREIPESRVSLPPLINPPKLPEVPFSAPGLPDFSRLLDVVNGRITQAQHRIRDLRHYPKAFSTHLQGIYDHSEEHVKYEDRSRNSHFKPNSVWEVSVGVALGRQLIEIHKWDTVRTLLEDIQKRMNDAATAGLGPTADLPRPLESQIMNLLELLQTHGNRVIMPYLHWAILSTPKIRDDFQRKIKPYEGIEDNEIVVQKMYPLHTTKRLRELLNLMVLINKMNGEVWKTLPLLISEVDASSRKARVVNLLSPYIEYLVSEMSLVADCWTQIHLYQPWAARFSHAQHKHEADSTKYNEDLSKIFGLIRKVGAEVARSQSARFFYGGVNYPASTPRTQESVNKRIEIENHLDEMWTGFEKTLRQRFREANLTIPPLVLEPIAQFRMERTLSWQADAADLAQARVAVAQEAEAAEGASRGAKRAHRGGSELASRKKKKTIGIPDPNRQPQEVRPQVPTPVGEQEFRHQVNADDWEVVTALYFIPNETAPKGIGFGTFVNFMKNLGFTVTSGARSRMTFKPPPMLDVKRQDIPVATGLKKGKSITFHLPHDSKNQAEIERARAWGRDLKQLYWFEGRMFEQKK